MRPKPQNSGLHMCRARCGATIYSGMSMASVLVEGAYRWINVDDPLCRNCFDKLTAAERLPHYREQWLATDPGPQDIAEWFKIESEVLANRTPGVPRGRGVLIGKDDIW